MNNNKFIKNLYEHSELSQLPFISARIEYLSCLFLGKPYSANPQGEGIDSEFDQAPLYRLDGFDCVTYVNNILALALSRDLMSFQKKLIQINYYDADAKFENRFHFMSLDWNIQNQKNMIVRDITSEIIDENKNGIVEFAEGEIDKPRWFLKKAESETEPRVKLLEGYAAKWKKELVRLSYLPLTTLFDDQKNPCEFIFNQIPHASIIEIVRPNWHTKDKIGTNLHVSHLGFLIRQSDKKLYFRHASSEQKSVVEILLVDYLKNYVESPTVKGIHLCVCLNTSLDIN